MSTSAAFARARSEPSPVDVGEVGDVGEIGEVGAFARSDAGPGVDEPRADERMALLLLTGTPGDVLARIVPGDPLGIALCVGRELRRGAFLLDAERVTRRAFARCARSSASWRGDPALAPWLRERVREAIEDLCRHELGRHDLGHGSGAPRPAEHGGGAFETIAAPLGLRVRSLRQACARFNGLARGEREAFFSILIDGQPLEQAAQRAGIALHEAARRARRGLELFRRAGVAAELPRATQAETRAP